MKKLAYILPALVLFTSCEKWLSDPQPNHPGLEDFFISGGGKAAIQVVNGAYVPLQWEYGSTYSPEWWIGDVVSDDALKGGQNLSDMSAAYDLENFKTQANNGILLDWYQSNYQGIARCNFALENIPNVATDSLMDASMQQRLMGEAKFLRAMYYFRLVRVFGDIPKITTTITSSSKWSQPKVSADDIYNLIIADLEDANRGLWLRNRVTGIDMGRATKGAAQAMLLKTHLYRQNWESAKAWGDSILNSGEYSLEAKYSDNFSIFHENGVESVFEVQYAEEATSDYGSFNPHFGATRGTFTTILTRSRSAMVPKKGSGSMEGWGFNKPTQDLYSEFETGDSRRETSILNLTDAQMSNPTEEIYLGCRYLSRKYAIMNDSTLDGLWNGHATRAPINIKLIRYSDVLLMYAEACLESGSVANAKTALEDVRARARALSTDPTTQLPQFPNYINRATGVNYTDDVDGLRQAIRHERRVELAMESHRWFDLCRWGIAKQTMDAYKANETPEAQAEMAPFIAGKNELFPLPQVELDLNPGMQQNPAWK